MKKFTKIVSTALMATLAMSMVGCSSPAEEAAPAPEATVETEEATTEESTTGEATTLVMATNAEFPPYEYYEGDKIVGIDVEIAELIAAEMGKELVIENINFDAVIPTVTSGKADIGIAGMTITEDRLVNVDFTIPYVEASQVIIVQNDNTDISTPEDLVGKYIGVQLGTTGDVEASKVADATIERYTKGFEAVIALEQGKVDAVVIDDQVAKSFAETNSNVKVIETPFTFEEYAIAVAKGNTELLNEINTILEELISSGKVDEIKSKYIVSDEAAE